MIKKKYLGGLSALLVLLFIMLLGTSSYASEWYNKYELDDNMVNYIFDFFGNSGEAHYDNKAKVFTIDQLFSTSYRSAIPYDFYSTKIYNSANKKAFKNTFNNINRQLKIPVGNYVFISSYDNQGEERVNYINIDAFPVNMENSNDYPFLYIYQNIMNNSYQQGYATMGFKREDNTLETTTRIRFKITTSEIIPTTHTLDYTQTYNFSYILRGTKSTSNIFDYWNNSDTALISKINICTLRNMPLYSTASLTEIGNNLQAIYPYILKSLYEHPVSDNPENPGTTTNPSGEGPGTTTNPSGEGPGTVDLSGIESGIGNINNSINEQGQAIVNNQNENTDKIIQNQNQNVDKINDTLTGTETDVNMQEQFDNMLGATDKVVDPTTNIFSWLIDNLRSILNDTGNYDLPIKLFDKTYIIKSDFFVLPDGDFKTFLQLAFIAWFGWAIIKKVHYIVYAVKCVNLSSVMNASDFNANIL